METSGVSDSWLFPAVWVDKGHSCHRQGAPQTDVVWPGRRAQGGDPGLEKGSTVMAAWVDARLKAFIWCIYISLL